MAETKQPYGSVLLKADQILDYLSQQNQPKKLNEIAKQTELTNPTTLKILNTLLLIGYVQKDPDTKTFSLGPRLIKYANKSLHQVSIKQIAQPHLEKLQRMTEETVHLGINELNHIKYISKIESKKPVSLYSEIGKTIPLYCSAMGKAVLADFTDEQIQQYLETNPFVKFTENTILTHQQLYEEIEQVKELSYAFDDGEHESEVFCVGSSITLNGKNYGAISVSLPKFRLNDKLLNDLIKNILICREHILAELS
ncbi:IclR family transcriptional regulator [Amphibacillus sp. Q70]|uniref:IclR family transcriptional regulator n=1 Tax=Amphibacillus sp. Q70 TaxID=3453416 RepID=UPI003F84E022